MKNTGSNLILPISKEDTKILKDLKKFSRGLLMPSESDYAFTQVFWRTSSDELTEVEIKKLVRRKADTAFEIQTLDYFFRNIAFEHDWQDDTQKKQVPQYRALLDGLKKELKQPQVYRLGSIKIRAYIVGKLPSKNFGGLKTVLIET